MKVLKLIFMIGSLSTAVLFAQNETIYEDAEDGTIDRWQIYDNDPAGASINNIFDNDLNSRVIELNGSLDNNGFVLTDDGAWDYISNTSQFVAEWKMKTSTDFRVYFYINTSAGKYYLVYDKSAEGSSSVSGDEIYYGLGNSVMNGSWQTIERDLKADFENAISGESISEVLDFLIRIDGSVDDIKLKDNSALPVELTTFTAEVVSNSVVLKWETATEVNNYGFDIESSDNKIDWKKIGFVKGNGNSYSPKQYDFITNYKSKYYRLKQIDLDGNYEYSKTVEVNLDLPLGFYLSQNYPNPFNPTTTIKYSIPTSPQHSPYQGEGVKEGLFVSLKVYNILGKKVATLINKKQQPGNHQVTFDATGLPNGIYFYKLQSGNFVKIKRMVLLK